MARIKEKYLKEIVPALMAKYSYRNRMEVPKLEKIVLNVGMGKATDDIKVLEAAAEELGKITGQKPVLTRAKKAISNFKLRLNLPIGARVTLRGVIMYEFLDRFINVALPRIKDFRGISNKGFDGRGNYNLGIKEQIIFPEIDYDKIMGIHGMNITFVTTAKTDKEAAELLAQFGAPFVKR
ncbi:MAG: 50S ribosomal protein L5 [Candidatus Firestonebacteria bacterium]|nr:50S ribosomal protein L5 [Candidatus Firestonebacteria bacterium]